MRGPTDFGGDGIPDLAALNSAGVDIFLGRGNGSFQPPQLNSFLGKGDGSFQPPMTYAVGGDPVWGAIADSQ